MDLRSQAVSVLIKEQQNVNKATVILHASPAVTARVLPNTGLLSYRRE
jgi:hypothetical protein